MTIQLINEYNTIAQQGMLAPTPHRSYPHSYCMADIKVRRSKQTYYSFTALWCVCGSHYDDQFVRQPANHMLTQIT